MDVIKELKFWGKFTKKNIFGGVGGVGRGGVGLVWGGQGGCERRIEVFVKIKKKKLGGGRSGGGWVGGGSGVMVDVNEELKFLGIFTQKNSGGREGRGQVGVGLVGVQGGCERNVGGRG